MAGSATKQRHPVVESSTGAVESQKSRWFGSLALIALAFLVYWPSLRGDFIWDDDLSVTANPLIAASDGLWKIWFSTSPTDYFPMTLSSFWFEWRLWGLNPTGYRVVNLLFHGGSAIALWRVLQAMRVRGAWFGAALFVAHPVAIATVAWISERKNTLSLLFLLVSVWFYLRDQEEPRRKWSNYFASLAAFVFALLSKTSVVMLPVFLLFYHWWKKENVTLRHILRIAPFFALSLCFGLLTIWFQNAHAIRGVQVQTETLPARLLEAGWALWFYAGKAFVPIHLSMIYPRWELLEITAVATLPLVGLTTLAALVWKFRTSWGRSFLFILATFCVVLLPALGILNMSYLIHSRVSDHLQYLGVVVVASVFGALIVHSANQFAAEYRSMARNVLGTMMLLLFAGAAWNRAQVFSSPENLWRDTVARNPNAWAAQANLGRIMGEQGKFKEAEEYSAAAVRIRPQAPGPQFNLGNALYGQGRFAEAEIRFREAARLQPWDASAHNNLANSLAAQGKLPEAIAAFREATRQNPNHASAWFNMGIIQKRLGQKEESLAAFTEAVRIAPGYGEAHSNLSQAYGEKQDYQRARFHAEQAVHLLPNLPAPRQNLARALKHLGDFSGAAAQWAEVAKLQPNDPDVHRELADALAAAGRLDEAEQQRAQAERLGAAMAEQLYEKGISLSQSGNLADAVLCWREAIRLKPGWHELINNVAWYLATSHDARMRNGGEALLLAQRAIDLSGGTNPSYFDTLAAAYAETGQFKEAVSAAEKGLAALQGTSQSETITNLNRHLAILRQGKPLRN